MTDLDTYLILRGVERRAKGAVWVSVSPLTLREHAMMTLLVGRKLLRRVQLLGVDSYGLTSKGKQFVKNYINKLPEGKMVEDKHRRYRPTPEMMTELVAIVQSRYAEFGAVPAGMRKVQTDMDIGAPRSQSHVAVIDASQIKIAVGVLAFKMGRERRDERQRVMAECPQHCEVVWLYNWELVLTVDTDGIRLTLSERGRSYAVPKGKSDEKVVRYVRERMEPSSEED